MLRNNDILVYALLVLVLIVGFYFIFKPKGKKHEKKGIKPDNKKINVHQEESLEQIENLNMVIFLLHDMAKEYSKSGYEKESIGSFVEKIVVSKTWEERLSSLPKTEENGEEQ